MNLTPSQVGARAEAAVAAALTAEGWVVYVPVFAGHSRVDLLFANGCGFHGVQCKTGRRMGDVLEFRTCSNTNNVPRSYGPEVEFFGVHSCDSGQVFLVPVEGLPSRTCFLRLEKPHNGQSKGIRWATDYLVGKCSSR